MGGDRRERSVDLVSARAATPAAPTDATPWTEERAVEQRADDVYMRRALALAERGWGRVSPNPMVGALLVLDGAVVGEGWHEGPGTDHAEVMALREAGPLARNSTLYCSLEPCDHTGRTGPCTQSIIAGGVTRVVAAVGDPNPAVAGRGFMTLREAHILVETGALAPDAQRLNEAYERHVTTGEPFVTLKMASSLDGKTAAADGTSRWITGPVAREDVQRLRAGSDAVMVGSGTALTDDPSLTVRLPDHALSRPPLRVVVDSQGRVPAEGNLFDGAAPTLVATTGATPEARLSAWTAAGAEVEVIDAGTDGRVPLGRLLAILGKRDVQGVLVEGGATLAWSLVSDGLVDKVVVYTAPLLIGGTGAPGALGGEGFPGVDAAFPLDLSAVVRLGRDVRMEAYVHRDH